MCPFSAIERRQGVAEHTQGILFRAKRDFGPHADFFKLLLSRPTETSFPLPPGSAGAHGELRILPAGEHTGDSVEWLSSSRMDSLVEELRQANDTVVFDSPPTLIVVDPVVLARYADGVLFVVDSRRTRRRDARRAVEALRAIGAPILGFAFNRSESRQSRYDAYRPRELRRQPWRPKETKV